MMSAFSIAPLSLSLAALVCVATQPMPSLERPRPHAERNTDVVFAEDFEHASLEDAFRRWTDIEHSSAMSLTSDTSAGARGSRALSIQWTGGASTGGSLYKLLEPGIDDVLYLRYYIKYPESGRYVHTGIWVGGSNPPLSYPNPRAGERPSGSDRFIAAAEQNTDSLFDHYNYWSGMRRSIDGRYWGNLLLNNPGVRLHPGRWTCIEQMIKLNTPPASNGEHALWIDGVKVSHLGPGFPRGHWSGGRFFRKPDGDAFEGFRWRTTSQLKLNWLWLQVYAPDAPRGEISHLIFDRIVAAKKYVGCDADA